MIAHRSGAGLACLALVLAPSCSRAPDAFSGTDASGVAGGSPWIGAAGPMFVEDCSLGCSSGSGGVPVDCGQQEIHVNEEIVVRFSRHVDLTTVTPSSFVLRHFATGVPAPGTFSLRPDDARTLSFVPNLSFDPEGVAIFALEPDEAYELVARGTGSNDPPPYVRSIEGRANESRIDCILVTGLGVMDYAPGAPKVRVLVDRIDPGTGDRLPDQPTPTSNVALDTAFDFEFDDVMNLATVVHPSTGLAPFLKVEIDADGDVFTTSDRLPVAGTWEVSYELAPPMTLATFTPDELLPGGGQPGDPRRIVASLPAQVVDLVGNPLGNGGETYCQPVLLPAVQSRLEEPFVDTANEELAASGATWGGGLLTFGQGGGSGRLGRLTVSAGELRSLDTGSLTFPLEGAPEDVLTNEVPGVDYAPLVPATWPEVTVEDGNFEFGSLAVDAGGLLDADGPNAARLFSRGELALAGVLDVAGASAAVHQGNSGNIAGGGLLTAFGGAGGSGGPNGSSGGAGGDRFNHGMNVENGCLETPLLVAGGISFDGEPAQNPGTDNDGRSAAGVGGTRAGSGKGGMHWPPRPPRTLSPTAQPCFGDAEFTVVTGANGMLECRIAMVAGAGSGGGYAFPGMDGLAFSPYSSLPSSPGLLPLTPGPTPGGDTTALGLELPGSFPPLVRDLDWHAGELRGGAGGGGGGMSLFGTRTNTSPATPTSNCITSAGSMFPYWDHSGAGGGGAGGATQLVSGRTLSLSGRIDAAGGDGGSSLDPRAELTDCVFTQLSTSCTSFAAPGGGGSGGAVKLQGATLAIANAPARVSVPGGLGGMGAGGSVGGDGSPGLVRLEQIGGGLDATQLAPRIDPYLPGDLGFNQPYLSAAILSLGDWEAPLARPDSYSASTSCWMRPDGPFFELEFVDDDPSQPLDPDAYGWNMDVLYDTPNGIKAFPYQGVSSDPDFPLGNVSFAEFLGNQLNHELPAGEGSLFCVRFQAARSTGALADPCDVDLGDPAQVLPGKLSPWVLHPHQLDAFALMPNMVRFTVAFDRSLLTQNAITQNIRGVTNLRIDVIAD